MPDSKLFAVGDGVRIEALGNTWAAYASATGQTLILNDEAAACLEILSERPRSLEQVADLLAEDTGQDPGGIIAILRDTFDRLVAAGLVKSCPSAASENLAPTPMNR